MMEETCSMENKMEAEPLTAVDAFSRLPAARHTSSNYKNDEWRVIELAYAR
jgi:hypothetical protein